MKKRLILLIGILAVGLCISSAVCAEESSGIKDDLRNLLSKEEVKNALFGENGLVNEILPEGAGLQTVEEQIGLVQSQGAQIIDAIQSKIDSADASFDPSELESLAGQLVGAITGIGGLDGGDYAGLLEAYSSILDAMESYYLEKNAEAMDPGDVQIVSISHAYQDDDYDQPEFKFISYLSQSNYYQDGNELRFASGAAEPVMFTFTKEEDGTITVVDAVFAEDGEGWLDSLQAMADEVGCPVQDILDAVDFGDYAEISDLISYMDAHEDIEGIEYMGEVKTREELEAIQSEIFDGYMAKYDTETEAESAETEAE